MEKYFNKTVSLVARELNIRDGDNPSNWKWSTDPATGVEVAELLQDRWLDIKGFVPVSNLPLRTLHNKANCEAFLVFKLTPNSNGLESVRASVGFVGYGSSGNDNGGCVVSLKHKSSRARSDGWMQIPIGVFDNNHGNCGWVEMRIYETSDKKKSGLIVKGFELHPLVT